MQTLFVGSTGPGSGLSLMTWFIAQRLLECGFKVAFMKAGSDPGLLGIPGKRDHDIELMRAVLGAEPVELGFFEGADVSLIMGSKSMFSDFSVSHLSDTQLVREHQAKICLMDRYQSLPASIYSILSIHSLFKGSLQVVVVNRVPLEDLQAVRDRLVPMLLAQGIPGVAVLPEDPILASFSLARMSELLGAEVLDSVEDVEGIVGGCTLGSHSLVGPLRIFRQVYGKIVLLALPDEQSNPDAVCSPDGPRPVVGIVLTGGRRPGQPLLDAARKAGIPLLLTTLDTFSAFDRIQSGASPVTKEDGYKERRFAQLLESSLTGAASIPRLFGLRETDTTDKSL